MNQAVWLWIYFCERFPGTAFVLFLVLCWGACSVYNQPRAQSLPYSGFAYRTKVPAIKAPVIERRNRPQTAPKPAVAGKIPSL